jgi:hypothetical protein
MLKTIMIAGALSLGIVAAGPVSPARADVDVGIGIGGGYGDGSYYRAVRRGISCGEGRRIVASAGFRRVRPLDCSGREYAFRGFRRDSMYQITVRSISGRITDIDRIRRGGGGYDDDYDDGGYGGGYDDYDEEY